MDAKESVILFNEDRLGIFDFDAARKDTKMDESRAKDIAKEAFVKCGFSADDELEKVEFERVLSELNFAFTKAKLDPLFRVGDLDLNGDRLVEKQNWRSVVIEKEKKEKAKRDMEKLRERMKEIEDARNLRLLIAAKIVEAKERCEKDAAYIKQKGELEEKLEKIREDIEVLQETMSEKAALFATKAVREKAHAREMSLMGREKATQNEYSSVMWSMKENEDWFADNVKYNEIEKSYEKYQYQRVIAGLSGFANAMDDSLDEEDEEDEDFFF